MNAIPSPKQRHTNSKYCVPFMASCVLSISFFIRWESVLVLLRVSFLLIERMKALLQCGNSTFWSLNALTILFWSDSNWSWSSGFFSRSCNIFTKRMIVCLCLAVMFIPLKFLQRWFVDRVKINWIVSAPFSPWLSCFHQLPTLCWHCFHPAVDPRQRGWFLASQPALSS